MSFMLNLNLNIMKKRVVKVSLLLSFCLMAYFSVPPNEVEAFGPVKFIQQTECINKQTGAIQGTANDCVAGLGACRDRGCLSGEVERWPIE